MKSPNTFCLVMLAAATCHAETPPIPSSSDCTAIVSGLQRLACFDRVAGTPPEPMPAVDSPSIVVPAATSVVPRPSALVDLIRQNEVQRSEGDNTFLVSRQEDATPGQTQIFISAPALDGAADSVYLALSCIANISRLQLLLPAPADRNQIRIRLFIDERPLSASRTWQVIEPGNVVDAGRGLVAIDLLRQFVTGGRLRVESDYAVVHGLMFDAAGLTGLIAQQREACHW